VCFRCMLLHPHRAVAKSQEWQLMFPKAGVRHLIAPSSDHLPIMHDTHLEICNLDRPFRFEAMWTRDPSCAEVIDNAWQKKKIEGPHCFKLIRKIQHTGTKLRRWNKTKSGQTKVRIQEIEKKIEELQKESPSHENIETGASVFLELEL